MSRNSRHPADNRVPLPDAAQRCEPSVTVTVLGRVDAPERGRKKP
jgi:hypothetical protein